METVVSESSSGSVVRLAEVASIEEGLEKARFSSRYGGYPAQLLTVSFRSFRYRLEKLGLDELGDKAT